MFLLNHNILSTNVLSFSVNFGQCFIRSSYQIFWTNNWRFPCPSVFLVSKILHYFILSRSNVYKEIMSWLHNARFIKGKYILRYHLLLLIEAMQKAITRTSIFLIGSESQNFIFVTKHLSVNVLSGCIACLNNFAWVRSSLSITVPSPSEFSQVFLSTLNHLETYMQTWSILGGNVSIICIARFFFKCNF